MTYVRKSWIGVLLLGAAVSAVVTWRARKPDYESVSVPELVLCKRWTTEVRHDPGTFNLVDCKTGKDVGAIYVVGGRAFSPEHLTTNEYVEPQLTWTWVDSPGKVPQPVTEEAKAAAIKYGIDGKTCVYFGHDFGWDCTPTTTLPTRAQPRQPGPRDGGKRP